MNITKYNKSAYRLAVWNELARLLREKYFPVDGTGADLFCDMVFRAPREVPQEIYSEVLVALAKAVRAEEDAMLRFKLEEIDDDEVRTLAKAEEAGSEGARASGQGSAQGSQAGKLVPGASKQVRKAGKRQ